MKQDYPLTFRFPTAQARQSFADWWKAYGQGEYMDQVGIWIEQAEDDDDAEEIVDDLMPEPIGGDFSPPGTVQECPRSPTPRHGCTWGEQHKRNPQFHKLKNQPDKTCVWCSRAKPIDKDYQP